MQKFYKLLIILFFSFRVASAYAAWDRQCLRDCFCTNHECNYCAYQCEIEEPRPAYDSSPCLNKCPLYYY